MISMSRVNRKKTIISITAFGIVFVVIIVAAFLMDSQIGTVFGIDEDTFDYLSNSGADLELFGKEYRTRDELETFLFVGTDYSGNENATGEEYQGSMADYLSLIAINHTVQTYAIIQINRDTMTKVSLMNKDGSSYAAANQQICTAHWYGGNKEMSSENTVNTVSQLLGGLPINGYYTVSVDDMARINNLVDGVEITFEEDMTEVSPRFKKGDTITLTDEEAHQLVRARRGVGDGENLSRMARQKVFVEAFISKIKSKISQDAKYGLELFDGMAEYAVTDINGKTVSRIANYIYKYQDLGVYSFEGENKVGQALGDGIDHTEFYLKEDSVIDVLSKAYNIKER